METNPPHNPEETDRKEERARLEQELRQQLELLKEMSHQRFGQAVEVKPLTLKERAKYIFLFLATLTFTTFAGAEWRYAGSWFGENSMDWDEFVGGLAFSIPFIMVLTVHEMGHYLTAKYYKVAVTPPFFIPLWLGFLGLPSIGTMGAFIQIKQLPRTTKEFFDIGIAGPLAGLMVAFPLLWYAFTHLPDPQTYIFSIHPEYAQWGEDYINQAGKTFGTLLLGDNFIFYFFKNYVAEPSLLPPDFEIMHYPLILAGYLSLVFTALNLVPVGSLDGGHVLYGLLGFRRANTVMPYIFLIFLVTTGLDYAQPMNFAQLDYTIIGENVLYIGFLFFALVRAIPVAVTRVMWAILIFGFQYGVNYFFPALEGFSGYLVFAIVLGRFLGIYHPPALDEHKLDFGRKALGWFTLLLFFLCFTPAPLQMIGE